MTSVRAFMRRHRRRPVDLPARRRPTPRSGPPRPMQVISPFSAGNAGDIVGRIVLDQVFAADRPVVRDREPAGRRRHHRRRRGRQGRAGRLHDPAALVLGELAGLAAQDLAVRSAARFRAGGAVRDSAERAGGGAAEGLQVGRRPGRRRQGKARRAELSPPPASVLLRTWPAERLRLATKLNVQHIPFRGPVEAFTEVMAGRIDFYFLPIAPALPVIRDGKVARSR